MTVERKNSIRELAARTRSHLGISADNEKFDLASAVKDLKGEIHDIPPDWEYRYDRVTRWEEDPAFIIWIDHMCAATRRRFSTAHEIGHLLIHMGYKTNLEKWGMLKKGDGFHRLPQNYSPTELEANEFAASFLMPEDLFRQVADEESNEQFYFTNTIAERFGVSKDAVSYRGRVLGLWH